MNWWFDKEPNCFPARCFGLEHIHWTYGTSSDWKCVNNQSYKDCIWQSHWSGLELRSSVISWDNCSNVWLVNGRIVKRLFPNSNSRNDEGNFDGISVNLLRCKSITSNFNIEEKRFSGEIVVKKFDWSFKRSTFFKDENAIKDWDVNEHDWRLILIIECSIPENVSIDNGSKGLRSRFKYSSEWVKLNKPIELK